MRKESMYYWQPLKRNCDDPPTSNLSANKPSLTALMWLATISLINELKTLETKALADPLNLSTGLKNHLRRDSQIFSSFWEVSWKIHPLVLNFSNAGMHKFYNTLHFYVPPSDISHTLTPIFFIFF